MKFYKKSHLLEEITSYWSGNKTLLSVLLFFMFSIGADALEEEREYEFKGVHFLASYCDCDNGALSDLSKLETVMHEAAIASGATILGSVSHIFPPDGLTLVILLSESHASIHTYPEHGSCFVDLFTCGNRCSAEVFDEVLTSYLKPQSVNKKILVRHEEIKDK